MHSEVFTTLYSFRKSLTFESWLWIHWNMSFVMSGFPVWRSNQSPWRFSLFTSQCCNLALILEFLKTFNTHVASLSMPPFLLIKSLIMPHIIDMANEEIWLVYSHVDKSSCLPSDVMTSSFSVFYFDLWRGDVYWKCIVNRCAVVDIFYNISLKLDLNDKNNLQIN